MYITMTTLKELFCIKDVVASDSLFSQEELETLSLLHHDKRHALKHGVSDPALEKALKHLSSKSDKPLYRGLRDEEIDKNKLRVGGLLNFKDYLSFSEDVKVAKSFAEQKIVIEIPLGAQGFCYWKWGVEGYEDIKDDPNVDTEYYINSFKEEAEWILPRNSKFLIRDIKKESGLTILVVEQM
jgi:hypothetical protein